MLPDLQRAAMANMLFNLFHVLAPALYALSD
jgi:hypothetical protein